MSDLSYDVTEHIARIRFDRPAQKNRFTVSMFRTLGKLFRRSEDDPSVRCVLLHATGDDFTGGLELQDVVPAWRSGEMPFEDGDVDPWGVAGARRTKPLVAAVKGRCFTLGTELALCSDVTVASKNTRFGLREVNFAIMPGGGGTFRFVRTAGWSNAMRYVLTGEDFDAKEAHRLGVVTDLVEGDPLPRAEALARRIATRAPRAVRAAIANSQRSILEGEDAAIGEIVDVMRGLLDSRDVMEAVSALFEGREPSFTGE